MNRKGIAFTAIITYLAVLALFIGVLSSTAIDLLNIIAHPLSPDPWEVLVLDVASTITNSQNAISDAVKAFPNADANYQGFLGFRIIGCSLVTLIFIWALWRGLKWAVPGAKNDLGTKLLILMIAIFLVWIIGLMASVLSGKGIPSFFGFYHGWIQLVLNRDVFIQWLTTHMKSVV
jgi:hypothetical protein